MIATLFAKQSSENYNCSHFVADAWALLEGRSIAEALKGFMLPAGKRSVPGSVRHSFKALRDPVGTCVVLLTRPHCAPHVGMWYQGKVLHLTERGVEYMPLEVASLGFKTKKFYKCL